MQPLTPAPLKPEKTAVAQEEKQQAAKSPVETVKPQDPSLPRRPLIVFPK
jgi:hypothetical protein